jgi:ABC-type lipoprotein release transport system permease subunit
VRAVDGRPARALPQTLIGLLAVAIAVGIAVPLTASIVMNGIRDLKQTRDTLHARCTRSRKRCGVS